jgi:HEAT repeat protein
MNDPYEDTRIAAIRAVGTVREPRAVQALTEQFSFYGRGDIGRAALWAIARIGSPESIPLLTSLTTDRDAEIRALAFEGLGRAGDATAMAAFESLYASERSRPGQLAIAFALQKNGRPFLGQLLVGLMDERLAARTRDYLLELGPSLVPALQGYLHDANAEVREQVAEVIGVMGNESAVRELDSLRADPNQAVALAAERAIQRIRLTQHP